MTTKNSTLTTGTMRASVLVRPGTVEVQDVPVPTLNDNQVLVRISAVGVCGSDTHFFHEGHIGDMVVTEPLILGHESAGTIVAVGAAVSPDRIGERVSIEPQKPCRVCEYCKSGQYNLCQNIEFYAAPPIHGAFAEFAAIESDFAYAVPDHVSDEAAALMEPLSVAIATCRKAAMQPGSSVLIAGAGPIGILVAKVARIYGATDITVSDPAAHRRDFALGAGATRAVDPRTEDPAASGPLFDVFVDASGAPAAIQAGIRAVKPGGKVVLVGMGTDTVALPVSLIQNREIELTGIFRYTNTWPMAINLVASGLVDLDALVTHRFALENVEAALLTGGTDPHAIKSVINPRS
ncbi:NAD(P)-dependent alcohol dehydrogenase [Arthrobacter sp. MMS18-M83]|uniref:NAD(P)-dependent alcohol dehydrogenase n=1 Tax=Arthrobacter sp. MMS18-M83 TaxID=2996261 RepID=UPI00227A7794|nr:NAD(P)-dependent alcohol dehydrogenase [Arthrobacter sp. MMS18-M83]WAH96345.1 NAD(P)-dependent alcohol dehydrogenase [Arthrobacter sp. MMS18-M83]